MLFLICLMYHFGFTPTGKLNNISSSLYITMFIDTHHPLNIAVDQVHPLLATASPSPPPNELKVLTWPSKLPQSQSDRVPPRETSMDLTCSILLMLDCFGIW